MIKLMRKLSLKEVLLIIPVIAFIVLQVFLDLKLPDYITEMTQVLQMPGGEINDIFIPGGKMILCALGSFAAAIITGYFVAYIAASFSQRLRKETFHKTEGFGMEEIKKFSVSSLVVRTTNDIANIQRFVAMGLQIILKAPILSVWAVSKIAGKSFDWSIYTGIAVLILLIIVGVIIFLVFPKTKIIQKLTDKLNTIVRENITGVRVIKAFNAEKHQKDKFSKSNEDVTKTNIFINKAMAFLLPTMTLIMTSLTLVIYLSGAYLIEAAAMQDKFTLFGDMVVFSSYAVQVIISFVMLVVIIIIYPRASVSASRIEEILKEESNIKDGPHTGKEDINGSIVFKNVTFKYPDADEALLEDISFEIKKGQMVAIIGGTASGKSSLVNLIPRFYDVTDGEILINGINIKNYNLEYLYSKMGFVSQKPVIFAGTIEENIKYGLDKLSKEDVNKAIEIAQAKEFVDKLEKREKFVLSARGTNISGGQKQRVSIARAVARDPEFFIFDDSFSALDYKTDSNLRKALKKNFKDRSMIIVAQRIGTIMNADQILVLDEGKLVGSGTHKELLKSCKVYKEIAKSQLSEKELEHE